MAWRATKKAGRPVRYFSVSYERAEWEAHFEFVRQMINKGQFQAGFGSCPDDADDSLTCMTFVIAEEAADDYVRTIKAAGKGA